VDILGEKGVILSWLQNFVGNLLAAEQVALLREQNEILKTGSSVKKEVEPIKRMAPEKPFAFFVKNGYGSIKKIVNAYEGKTRERVFEHYGRFKKIKAKKELERDYTGFSASEKRYVEATTADGIQADLDRELQAIEMYAMLTRDAYYGPQIQNAIDKRNGVKVEKTKPPVLVYVLGLTVVATLLFAFVS
jgi:hypothetical protein